MRKERTVATMTIKNMPDPLLKRLKKQAVVHRRSLNLEVIACLEQLFHSAPVDPDALLVRARALRRSPRGLRVTDRVLRELKLAGRP